MTATTDSVGVQPGQTTALVMSTTAFAACFAVWTIFSIIGLRIREDLALNSTEFGLLIGTPILTGSLARLVLGILAELYGGRRVLTVVMLISSLATWSLVWADSYNTYLLAALVIGLSGGSFAAGVAYVSKWYPKKQQGTVLGIFGIGNIGTAVTSFLAPFVMVSFGWMMVAQVWAAALIVVAIAFFMSTRDEPGLAARRESGRQSKSLRYQLEPLKKLQVWRFSLYYLCVFGAFVALALWLPGYYVNVYKFDVVTAGMLGAAFSIPGSLFRMVGGILSDRLGARRVMYLTFLVTLGCTFILSYPATDYVVHGIEGPIEFTLAIGFVPFTILTFILGLFMALGMAAVFKHIPVYYPDQVGAVGGVVGMIGGLGGFILPLVFGGMNDLVGVWTSCFMLLFCLIAVALVWMHFAIRRLELRQSPELAEPKYLPELSNEVPKSTRSGQHGQDTTTALDRRSSAYGGT